MLFDCVRKKEGEQRFSILLHFADVTVLASAQLPLFVGPSLGLYNGASAGYEKVCSERDVCAGQLTGVPEETFTAIETLLPTGINKFLELYAPIGASRPGWTHVAVKSI